MLKELSKVEQRYDAVLAVIREGMRVSEVAEKFGVHRDTVYSWLARYEAEGLTGLEDRSHRPRTSPLQMPAVIEARVLELRRNRPHWGPMSLRHQLAREGVAPLPSISGIYRALLRHGLIEPKSRRRGDLLGVVQVRVYENGCEPYVTFPQEAVFGVETDQSDVAEIVARARAELVDWR